jgi:hypothetical protein
MKTPKKEAKRIGRPPGKRSDPAYQPVTAWIRKQTYQAVRRRLFDEARREFSVLVEELLVAWLRTAQKKRPRVDRS